MKKSKFPRLCKFSLTILATFVLGTVFIFANPVQAFAEEATEHVTLDQHHIDMIQEAFNNVVPISSSEMRLEINLHDVLDCRRAMNEIIDVLLAPVYDVIDEIVQGFIALSGPDVRSNITLNEVRIDVDHELICSIRISVNTMGEFIATNIGYSFYVAALETFLTQNYDIEPFASPHNRIGRADMHVNDQWTGFHAATLTSTVMFFRRDDNAIFIQEGDIYWVSNWHTIIDSRMVSSIDIWGRTYHNNGTVNASAIQRFRVHHVSPTGQTHSITWFVEVRP